MDCENVVITKRVIVTDGKAVAVPVAEEAKVHDLNQQQLLSDLPPAFILDGRLYNARGEEIDVASGDVGRRFRIYHCGW